jgi:hypothetical protein
MISTWKTAMTEFRIYVGVPHSDYEEAKEFIYNNLYTPMTITEATGVWNGPEGHEQEDSLVITVLTKNTAMPDMIEAFADAYAEKYDQAQIIWTTQALLYTDREYE